MGIRMVRTATIIIISGLFGCAAPQGPPVAAIPPDHDRLAVEARDAFVADDEALARAKLAAVAGLGIGLPAPTDDTAGSLVAVAVACGACHTRAGVGLPAPAQWAVEGDGVRSEMQRHGQGLEQLWSGFVRPDAADRALGARTLHTSQLFLTGPTNPAAEAMDDSVTVLADQVAAARTPQDAEAPFAALLRQCRACHATRPGGLNLEPD